MSISVRKTLVILGFLAIVFALAYLMYILFFRGPLITLTDNTNQAAGNLNGALPISGPYVNGNVAINTNGQLPVAGNLNANINVNAETPLPQATAKSLTQTIADDITMAPNGRDLYYYNPQDGKFYRIGPNGEIIPLTDEVFNNVSQVNWSPDKNKAIIEYPDNYKIVYDFAAQKQLATLPRHWQEFSFSPDGVKFVGKSLGIDSENRWLMVANSDGTGAQAIEELGDNADKVQVAWSPNNLMIATYTEAKDFDRQDVYLIGLHGENFRSLNIDGRGFESNWSPQGNRLLYSVYSSDSDYKPTLWLAEIQGDSFQVKKNLNLNTWVEKCVFYNNDNIYCAVPQDLQSGAGFSPELARTTPDDIYQINIASGAINKLDATTYGHTVEKITISTDGQYLYFTDINDGRLYQINLK